MVKIGADTTSLVKGMQDSVKSVNGFSSGTVSASKAFTAVIMANVAAVVGFGTACVVMANKAAVTKEVFTGLIGDSQKATTFLSNLQQFTSKTKFDLPGIQDIAKKMLALGMNANDIIPELKAVGDNVTAVGGGTPQVQAVVDALSKMSSSGNISLLSLNKLQKLGVPAMQILEDKFHMTGAQLEAAMKNGSINANTAVQGLLTGMETKFGGTMANESQTFNGLMKTFQDDSKSTMTTIGKALLTAFDGKGAMQSLINLTLKVKELANTFISLTATMSPLKALVTMIPPSLQATIMIVAGAITAAMIPAFIAMAAAAVAAVIPLLPFIAAGAAVGAMAYAVMKAWGPVTTFFKTTVPAAFNSSLTLFTSFGTKVTTFFTNLKTSAITQITAMGKGIVTGVTNMVNSCITWFTTLKTQASAKVTEIYNTITSWFQKLPGAIMAFLNPLPEKLAYLFGYGLGLAVKAILDGVTKIYNYFSLMPGKISAYVTTTYNNLVTLFNKMKTEAVSIATAMINNIMTFISTFPGKMSAQLSATYTQVTNWFKNMGTNALNLATNMINTVMAFITTFPGKMSAQLSATYTQITNWFTNMRTNAVNLATNMVNSVMSFINQFPGKVSSALSGMATQVTNWFNNAKNSAASIASNMVSTVWNTISGLPGKFSQMGQSIVNTVSGFAKQLWDKAAAMGKQFWEGFKKGIGIGSPSLVERAFTAIGNQALDTVDTIINIVPHMRGALSDLQGPSLALASASANGIGVVKNAATAAPVAAAAPAENASNNSIGNTIHIETMNVRSDADIVKISQQLYRLQQSQARPKGGRQ
jgi:tape measure domain-containing protein